MADHRFAVRYPQDFPGAPPLSPMLLYVDATDAAEFGGPAAVRHQAECLLIVSGTSRKEFPDLPLAFADDFIDAKGRKDQACAQWPRHRALVNLFMRSRAAALMRFQRPNFDLGNAADFASFKSYDTLYDFDHRDRDWSQPLGHRVARGFWQAVWNSWFNASNDHPWDGDAGNRAPANFRPYTFANDPADLLVLYQMLSGMGSQEPQDNRRALAREVLANLMALQHHGADNFALPEPDGKQEHYTAGAFRYGMFETGEWLTEGRGWFANPRFRDFIKGGVFNGRCVWALGESIKAAPKADSTGEMLTALAQALRFCLHDGLGHHYTTLTQSGLPVWCPIDGEHAYLLLGMLAACEAVPDMPVKLDESQRPRPLRDLCVDALNALAETAAAGGGWSRYANANAVNIAALAEGCRLFPDDKKRAFWQSTAVRAADLWLGLKPLPAERAAPTPMIGNIHRDGGMSFILGRGEPQHVSLYIGGHWLHALSVLHTVAKDARYHARAAAILAYYCGDNPLHVRLLNELGAVNNRVTDADGDGIEDQLAWDAYPESTAFVQIGLLHFLEQ